MPNLSCFAQGPPHLSRYALVSRYALAVLATIACTLIRFALDPWLEDQVPFAVFIFGIMASAVVGGLGPGLLATLLSVAASHYFFYQPRFIFFVTVVPHELLSLVLFGLAGVFISYLCEALRNTEEFSRRHLAELQSIYAGAPIGLCSLDAELRYRSINDRLAAINGRPAAEHLGRTLRQMLPAYIADAIEPLHRQVLQTGQPLVDYEISAASPAQPGALHHWLINYFPIKDNSGRVVGINSVVQDITERKQAEARLRRIVDSGMVGVAYFTLDGQVLEANDEYLRIVGYTRQELQAGQINWQAITPAEYDQADAYAIDQLRTKGVISSFEKAYVRRDGTRVPILLNAASLEPSNQTFVAVAQDITDRKRAEEALKESEERFRLAVEAAGLTTWDYNPQADQLTWSDSDGAWGNASQVKMPLGQFLAFVHADDRRSVQQAIQRALDPAGSREYAAEYRVVRPNGTIQWLAARGRAIFSGEGPRRQAVRFVGIAMDITDRKRGEEALQQAKAQAEAANAAKDQFLAALSHELRTPLTPVLAAVSLLERDEHLEAESRDDVQMIRRNVELEARLIDDLLDLTRIVRGKLELRPRRVDVCEVLQHTLDICMPDFKAKNLHVAIPCMSDHYWVQADSARLQQVFWNLVKNAIKFTPEGGCIGIRCFRGSPEQIAVEVADSGIGIDPALLSRLFDAFEQGGRATTRQFGGLGLGLAISKAIVELHGGTITAESPGPGKGSTFRVTLPAALSADLPPVPTPTEVSPVPPTLAPDRVSVLLVEDHADTASIMAHLLRASGYRVETAATIQKALHVARQHHFDLLVSDVGLPDGDGLDLMRRLRAAHPQLQAIAMSGYGMDEDIRRSQEAGFAEHLVKPVDLKRLEAAIHRLTQVAIR